MEMPESMNSSNGKAFPKMQVYTEFDYDKVVELINSYSPAFSKGTVKGVLDTLATVMKYANLNTLSRTQASRDLTQWVSDPTSGIKASGNGPLKCWVRG